MISTKSKDAGAVIFTALLEHLQLNERAYFGLRYLDEQNQVHWLEPETAIGKQLRNKCATVTTTTTAEPQLYALYFCVKFYTPHPDELADENSRYQFFLQIKQDISHGRLHVPYDTLSELCAYAVQSDLGDYDPGELKSGYTSEYNFSPEQDEALFERVESLHKKLMRTTPAEAERAYLSKVKHLELYGVDLHPITNKAEHCVDYDRYFLGLSPAGIMIIRTEDKMQLFSWSLIVKLTRPRAKYVMLHIRATNTTGTSNNNKPTSLGFCFPTSAACVHFFKSACDYKAFFSHSGAGVFFDSKKINGFLLANDHHTGKNQHNSSNMSAAPASTINGGEGVPTPTPTTFSFLARQRASGQQHQHGSTMRARMFRMLSQLSLTNWCSSTGSGNGNGDPSGVQSTPATIHRRLRGAAADDNSIGREIIRLSAALDGHHNNSNKQKRLNRQSAPSLTINDNEEEDHYYDDDGLSAADDDDVEIYNTNNEIYSGGNDGTIRRQQNAKSHIANGNAGAVGVSVAADKSQHRQQAIKCETLQQQSNTLTRQLLQGSANTKATEKGGRCSDGSGNGNCSTLTRASSSKPANSMVLYSAAPVHPQEQQQNYADGRRQISASNIIVPSIEEKNKAAFSSDEAPKSPQRKFALAQSFSSRAAVRVNNTAAFFLPPSPLASTTTIVGQLTTTSSASVSEVPLPRNEYQYIEDENILLKKIISPHVPKNPPPLPASPHRTTISTTGAGGGATTTVGRKTAAARPSFVGGSTHLLMPNGTGVPGQKNSPTKKSSSSSSTTAEIAAVDIAGASSSLSARAEVFARDESRRGSFIVPSSSGAYFGGRQQPHLKEAGGVAIASSPRLPPAAAPQQESLAYVELANDSIHDAENEHRLPAADVAADIDDERRGGGGKRKRTVSPPKTTSSSTNNPRTQYYSTQTLGGSRRRRGRTVVIEASDVAQATAANTRQNAQEKPLPSLLPSSSTHDYHRRCASMSRHPARAPPPTRTSVVRPLPTVVPLEQSVKPTTPQFFPPHNTKNNCRITEFPASPTTPRTVTTATGIPLSLADNNTSRSVVAAPSSITSAAAAATMRRRRIVRSQRRRQTWSSGQPESLCSPKNPTTVQQNFTTSQVSSVNNNNFQPPKIETKNNDQLLINLDSDDDYDTISTKQTAPIVNQPTNSANISKAFPYIEFVAEREIQTLPVQMARVHSSSTLRQSNNFQLPVAPNNIATYYSNNNNLPTQIMRSSAQNIAAAAAFVPSFSTTAHHQHQQPLSFNGHWQHQAPPPPTPKTAPPVPCRNNNKTLQQQQQQCPTLPAYHYYPSFNNTLQQQQTVTSPLVMSSSANYYHQRPQQTPPVFQFPPPLPVLKNNLPISSPSIDPFASSSPPLPFAPPPLTPAPLPLLHQVRNNNASCLQAANVQQTAGHNKQQQTTVFLPTQNVPSHVINNNNNKFQQHNRTSSLSVHMTNNNNSIEPKYATLIKKQQQQQVAATAAAQQAQTGAIFKAAPVTAVVTPIKQAVDAVAYRPQSRTASRLSVKKTSIDDESLLAQNNIISPPILPNITRTQQRYVNCRQPQQQRCSSQNGHLLAGSLRSLTAAANVRSCSVVPQHSPPNKNSVAAQSQQNGVVPVGFDILRRLKPTTTVNGGNVRQQQTSSENLNAAAAAAALRRPLYHTFLIEDDVGPNKLCTEL